MKKVMFAAIVAGGFLLTSCGAANDPGADAQQLCDCMTAAAANPEKAEQCGKLSEEYRIKYEGNIEATTTFAEVTTSCMQDAIPQ
jgi:hypothetical protein